jgi:hypothetical protein
VGNYITFSEQLTQNTTKDDYTWTGLKKIEQNAALSGFLSFKNKLHRSLGVFGVCDFIRVETPKLNGSIYSCELETISVSKMHQVWSINSLLYCMASTPHMRCAKYVSETY